MAEGLLKKRLEELEKTGIDVRSAGARALNGMPPTDETIEVMNEEGVDVAPLRSKNLNNEMIKNADLILVMEGIHKIDVIRRVPEAAAKTHLLKEFGQPDSAVYTEGYDVPDPIGRPLKDYKSCVNMIKKAIDRIAKLL
jgi:protein-tyrosine phosphatase